MKRKSKRLRNDELFTEVINQWFPNLTESNTQVSIVNTLLVTCLFVWSHSFIVWDFLVLLNCQIDHHWLREYSIQETGKIMQEKEVYIYICNYVHVLKLVWYSSGCIKKQLLYWFSSINPQQLW